MNGQTENKLPAVSVIMPTYNRSAVIGRAIDSVLAQTHRNFELIIIDDGSTDDTPAMVKGFDDDRIRFIKTGRNCGAAAARNLGIKAARNDLIAFLDSDDQWLENFLETLVKKMISADDKTAVVYSAYFLHSAAKEIVLPSASVRQKTGDILPELVRKNFVALPTILVKRICFEQCGVFDESLPCRHDWELFLRIAHRWRFSFVPEPLVRVYRSEKSISSDYRFKIAGWKPVIEKHLKLFKKYPGILSEHYLQIACACDYLNSDNEFKQMKKLVFRAVAARPLINKKYLHLLLASVLGKKLYLKYRRLKNRLLGKTN